MILLEFVAVPTYYIEKSDTQPVLTFKALLTFGEFTFPTRAEKNCLQYLPYFLLNPNLNPNTFIRLAFWQILTVYYHLKQNLKSDTSVYSTLSYQDLYQIRICRFPVNSILES